MSETEVTTKKEERKEKEEELAFLIQSPDPAIWKTVTKTLQKIVEEATFSLDGNGVSLRSMNDSHNLAVERVWPSSEFIHYDCPRPTKFTVKVEDFTKVIGRAPEKEPVRFSREDRGELKIQFGNNKEFSMHLLEDIKPFPELKLLFDSKITFKKDAFNDALSDVWAVSSVVRIRVNSKDDIAFYGKGDLGNVQRRFSNDDILNAEVLKESSGSYSLDLLMAVNPSASAISPTIDMNFTSKYPVQLVYPLAYSEDRPSASFLRVYLAPRVVEQDE